VNFTTKKHEIHVKIKSKLDSSVSLIPGSRAGRFEIAQSLFALKQTCILGAMALNEKKSGSNFERFAHEQYKDKRAQ